MAGPDTRTPVASGVRWQAMSKRPRKETGLIATLAGAHTDKHEEHVDELLQLSQPTV